MEMNATDFRRNFFEMLNRALQGEDVAILYRGARLSLRSEGGQSKLARAVRRNALLVPPDSIVHSDEALIREFESGWKAGDESL